MRNITWQVLPSRTPCEHRYEVLDHEVGNALKQCVHRGSLAKIVDLENTECGKST